MACVAACVAPAVCTIGSRFVPSASNNHRLGRRAFPRSTMCVPKASTDVASSATVVWPDGAGTAEMGTTKATAFVVNLGTRGQIATGLPFLDHMIDQLTSHAQLGVSVLVTRNGVRSEPCNDQSGTAEEDTLVARAAGRALGEALKQTLAPGVAACRCAGGENKTRNAAEFAAPLDEAYSTCVLDVLGVGNLSFGLAPYGPGTGRECIGTYRTLLTEPFFEALTEALGFSITLKKQRGDNAHHIVEATFKAFARCVRGLMDGMDGIGATDETSDTDSVSHAPAVHRAARSARATKETNIDVSVDLDGTTKNSSVVTGIKTLDSLLLALAEEADFTLNVAAKGDLWIDDHHTTEDVAITVGQVLNTALKDKAGCNRMGRAVATVNECTVEVIADLSNRPYLGNGLAFADEKIDDLSTEMIDHLFMSITSNAQMTAHIVHHKNDGDDGVTYSEADLALAAARALGKCLKQCVAIDNRRAGAVASSKGTLSV